MLKSQVQIFYAGRVQGVGFRFTVKQLARGYDLTGLIRNLPDGRVELVGEGTKDELEAFLQAIEDSGLAPLIEQREVAWGKATGTFSGFEIIG